MTLVVVRCDRCATVTTMIDEGGGTNRECFRWSGVPNNHCGGLKRSIANQESALAALKIGGIAAVEVMLDADEGDT